jgi:hypothetical protein
VANRAISFSNTGAKLCLRHCRGPAVGGYFAPEARALFRSSRRRLIVYLLSLALLIAQLGMEAHAYSHLKSDPDGLPGQTTQLCGQCASSAPLLSMASSSSCIRVPFAPQVAGIAPASIGTDIRPLPHPPFRSRAPPRLF